MYHDIFNDAGRVEGKPRLFTSHGCSSFPVVEGGGGVQDLASTTTLQTCFTSQPQPTFEASISLSDTPGQGSYVHSSNKFSTGTTNLYTFKPTSQINFDQLDHLHNRENLVVIGRELDFATLPSSFLVLLNHIAPKIFPDSKPEDFTLELNSWWFKGIFCESTQNWVYHPIIERVGRYSPYRAHRSNINSASRLKRQLQLVAQQTGFDFLISLVLTIPHSNQGLTESDLKRAFQSFSKRLAHHLKNKHLKTPLKSKFKAEISSIVNYHLWGSEEVNYHPHIHVLIPNLLKISRTTTEGVKIEDFVIIPPKISVEKLKELWITTLLELGYTIPINGDGKPQIDLYIRHFKVTSSSRMMHILKYNGRRPIQDLVTFCSNNEFLPAYLFDEDWLTYLFTSKNQRRVYGWLRGLLKDAKPEKKPSCPVCGGYSVTCEVTEKYITDIKTLACVRIRGKTVEVGVLVIPGGG